MEEFQLILFSLLLYYSDGSVRPVLQTTPIVTTNVNPESIPSIVSDSTPLITPLVFSKSSAVPITTRENPALSTIFKYSQKVNDVPLSTLVSSSPSLPAAEPCDVYGPPIIPTLHRQPLPPSLVPPHFSSFTSQLPPRIEHLSVVRPSSPISNAVPFVIEQLQPASVELSGNGNLIADPPQLNITTTNIELEPCEKYEEESIGPIPPPPPYIPLPALLEKVNISTSSPEITIVEEHPLENLTLTDPLSAPSTENLLSLPILSQLVPQTIEQPISQTSIPSEPTSSDCSPLQEITEQQPSGIPNLTDSSSENNFTETGVIIPAAENPNGFFENEQVDGKYGHKKVIEVNKLFAIQAPPTISQLPSLSEHAYRLTEYPPVALLTNLFPPLTSIPNPVPQPGLHIFPPASPTTIDAPSQFVNSISGQFPAAFNTAPISIPSEPVNTPISIQKPFLLTPFGPNKPISLENRFTFSQPASFRNPLVYAPTPNLQDDSCAEFSYAPTFSFKHTESGWSPIIRIIEPPPNPFLQLAAPEFKHHTGTPHNETDDVNNNHFFYNTILTK